MKSGTTYSMPIAIPRRFVFPALAGLLVLALASWQWVTSLGAAPVMAAPGLGINAISWDDQALTLSGHATPNSAVAFTLGGVAYPARADASGDFAVTLKAEQRSPTRATLALNDAVYSVLLVRLQGKWAALQRVVSGSSSTTATQRGWVPAAGLGRAATVTAAILAVTKDDSGYAVAFTTPAEHTAYVYGNGRLAAVVKISNDNAPAIALLPAVSTQMRLDVYDTEARLAQRLRLVLPPSDATAHYTLNDGDVWIPTDYTAQKAETDETFAGQFIPDARAPDISPAAGAPLPDKAAPPAQSGPTR